MVDKFRRSERSTGFRASVTEVPISTLGEPVTEPFSVLRRGLLQTIKTVNTGSHVLLSTIGVSRVGLEERFGLEETRLASGLKVFLSFKASGVSLPDDQLGILGMCTAPPNVKF